MGLNFTFKDVSQGLLRNTETSTTCCVVLKPSCLFNLFGIFAPFKSIQ